MAVAWRGTLPTEFQSGSYRRRLDRQYIENSTDAPLGKRRRRSTLTPSLEGGRMRFTGAQVTEFEAFVKDDLAGGVAQFTMFDPMGGADRICQLRGDFPEFLHVGRDHGNGVDYYDATISLTVFP